MSNKNWSAISFSNVPFNFIFLLMVKIICFILKLPPSTMTRVIIRIKAQIIHVKHFSGNHFADHKSQSCHFSEKGEIFNSDPCVLQFNNLMDSYQ